MVSRLAIALFCAGAQKIVGVSLLKKFYQVHIMATIRQDNIKT